MKKITRVALISTIAVVTLALMAGAAAMLLIDPNAYKNQIVSLVKEHTGRDLVISGDIKLSVFPWIGVSLGALELGNAPGFGPEPMVRLQAANVKVKLLPLLKRQVQIAGIVVDGAQINLGKDKNGKTNWSDLTQPAAASDPATPATPAPDSSSPALAGLTIGGIEIRNTAVTWQDAATGAKQKIEGLTLRTGSIELGQPTDLSLTFNVATNDPPATATIEAKTRLTLNTENQHYQLDDLRIESRFKTGTSNVSGDMILTTNIDANVAKDLLTVSDLHVAATIKQAETNVETKADLNTGIIMGIASQQLRIDLLKLKAINTGPTIPGGRAELNASTEISADLKQQTLHITDLIADGFGLKLAGEIRGSKIIDAPNLTGQLAATEFNPRELLAKLGQPTPDMADATAMTKASAKLDFNFTPQRLQLSELRAQLDDTAIRAQGAVKNFAKPGIEFDIEINQIDVDRYLPPKPAASTTPVSTPSSPTPPADFPVEPLRQLDLKGKLTIGKVKVSNLRAEQVLASISAKDGLIQVQPLNANLYQGKYVGHIQADARGAKLQVNIDETLTGIQAGPLLKDFMGDDKFSGVGNAAIKAQATGNNVDAMIAALNGNGSFNLRDGAVKGFNLGKLLREAQAKLRGEPVTPDDQGLKTDFSALDATFQIKNGIADNRDLSLKSPLLRVTGQGSANLPAQEVDYVLTATIVGTTKGQEGRELEELKGLPIDVKMQGKFANPSFKIDLGAALKAKAQAKIDAKKEELKQEADEKIDEKKDELKQKAEDQLRDKFKKLF